MEPGDFADIDTKTASSARVYDYMLGGYFLYTQNSEMTSPMSYG
jgi:hypothetical protein